MKPTDRENVLSGVRERFDRLAPMFTAPLRRLWAAAEAVTIGRGGVALVAQATGLARATILRGRDDLDHPPSLPLAGERRPGAGRKPLVSTDRGLLADLDGLLDSYTTWEPASTLSWACRQ